jgi:hypothetical protein
MDDGRCHKGANVVGACKQWQRYPEWTLQIALICG